MKMENNEFKSEIQKQLNKEMQFEIEKEKVSESIIAINKEIARYVKERQGISQYILDYRKKAVEEFKDDEDKIVEYFDHERYVKEELYRTIDRRLKELTILVSSPYFGRVDFKEAGFDEIENMYIGRFGVTPDESYEPLVVDWRTPVASLFYTGGLGTASYNAPDGKITTELLLKRQYIIKKAKLKGLFDSALDVKDDILQMVLSGNSGEKLKDIIMTIQEEQDVLIRQPREKTIVVNGTAGSGKTTIALHRVAYLLYNFRNILQNKVLIFGPNNIFMEYISTVLPTLGEDGVSQLTFKEFAINILGLDKVMSFQDYMERVLREDETFIQEIKHKTSTDYIEELDRLTKKLNSDYFKFENILFNGEVIVSVQELKELFNVEYIKMPLFRRSNKIRRIVFGKIKDARDKEVREIEKEYKDALKGLSKEEIEIKQNSVLFLRKTRIREVIEEVIRAKKSLAFLDNADVLESYKKFNSYKELTTDDLAPILYLKLRLEGLKLPGEFRHVVIDEAQDYSELQFIVIKELTGCYSLTIVGDTNQRMIPVENEIAMLHVEKTLPSVKAEHFVLNKSYRSTKEIITYANKYLKTEHVVPLVRNGAEVIEKRISSDEELKKEIYSSINDLKEKGFESIAIISRNGEETEKIGKLIKNVSGGKIMNREDIIYSTGVTIIPSYFAKGLEFDAVILMKDKEIKEGDKLMYVMATRALHELHVFSK
jgi:DNA helicase-2/ATP-dependent DNA helicase PcrA